jgi:glucokinase
VNKKKSVANLANWDYTVYKEAKKGVQRMKYGFGIDLGGTTVKLAYFDEDGTMLDKWEIPTDKTDSGKNILPDIADEVKKYMENKQIPRESLIGIGIGVPGPVRTDGTVTKCVNLGWNEINVEKELSRLTGLPVKGGNDASVAALGECWKGGAKGCKNIVFATLGTGVGGGIVIGGKVVHGAHGAGGEIGHMCLNRDETESCNCGKKGCAEQYCSATGIVRLAKQALRESAAPSVLRDIKTLTCKDVFDAAAAEDALAREILEQVYAYMGEFLANICNVVDPEYVVLGGGVSRAGQPLLDGVQRRFKKAAFLGACEAKFALATLGNDAGAYGAFKMVKESYDE